MEWFKFSWGHYMTGKIARMNDEHQASFIRLCCLYCKENGELSVQDAVLECSSEKVFDDLLKRKIIERSDDQIIIKFMDPQIEKQAQISAQNSAKGKASGEARRTKKSKQQFNSGSTTVKQQLNNGQTAVEQKERERDNPPKGISSNDTILHSTKGDTPAAKKILWGDFSRCLPSVGQEKIKEEFANYSEEFKRYVLEVANPKDETPANLKMTVWKKTFSAKNQDNLIFDYES